MTEQKRGPGRPKNTERGEAHKPEGRARRVPMGQGLRLAAPKIEGYQLYWALEGPTRIGVIAQMKDARWAPVLEDGKPVTVPAGNGDIHYLMKIEQKYYDEDIAAQQKQNIDATQKNVQALGEEEYVPMGRETVVERDLI